MNDVVVSVVAHNQRRDLERLLPSLLSAAARVNAQIRIVANRSTDRTVEFLNRVGPAISVTDNPCRAGYGQNHNLNLRGVASAYFVVLNADLILADDVLQELMTFMDTHPDVGIVAPRILDENGEIQGLNKRLPTVWDLFLRRFGRFAPSALQERFRRRLDYYEMRDVGYDGLCDVPFVSGAFMFCRTEVLQRLGGFDERYFLYFEDVDLCRRVNRTHRTMYFPGSSAVHTWKRAAHRDWRFTSYFMSSAAKYFARWGIRVW